MSLKDTKNIELLAPAGNFDSLKAAIINGANAVYVGLNEFSARSKAENFNLAQLKEAVDYVHLFGAKIYVAMNTLIKDSELDFALDLVEKVSELGVDAFILQDIGFLLLFKKRFPHLIIHASTQMGIHNYYGAMSAKDLGIKRVILSRETTYHDICKIREEVPDIEIECFVHGAQCVSFSGNCYFSSLVSSYSGNRGKCLQLCRKKYELIANDKTYNGYYLSPRDLCLIDEVKGLIDIGVNSFKIEGRMRKPEYVAEAVRLYRKAIDMQIDDLDLDPLKRMYNRGDYSKGHLINATENTIYPYTQNHIGVNVGVVESIVNNVANLSCELNEGDGVKFLRNNREVGHAQISKTGTKTSFIGSLKVNDAVHITTDKNLIDRISIRKRRINLDCIAYLTHNKAPKATCVINGKDIAFEGDYKIESAQTAPITFNQALKALQYEDDIFEMNFDVRLDPDIFIPTSQLKALRRGLLLRVKEELLKQKKASVNSTMSDIVLKLAQKSSNFFKNSKVFVQIDESNFKLPKYIVDKSDYIIFSPRSYTVENVKHFVDTFKDKAILSLPNVARGADIAILKEILSQSNIANVVVNNLYGLKLCEDKNIILGLFFNQLNSVLDFTKIMSIESERISKDNINYCYGYLPLMTLTHCVKKTLSGSCVENCEGLSDYKLRDETNSFFTLRRVKIQHCYSQLINGICTYISMNKNCKRLIDFTSESDKNLIKIFDGILSGSLELKRFTKGNLGKQLK